MCEGVFLFLQLFKLTTSNWFEHTVRAQRAHEVQWTSALSRPKRSGDPTRSGGPRPGPTEAERRPHEVRGTSAWTDRSGAETPRGPGDLGLDRPKRRP